MGVGYMGEGCIRIFMDVLVHVANGSYPQAKVTSCHALIRTSVPSSISIIHTLIYIALQFNGHVRHLPFFSTSHQRTLVARYMLMLVARSHHHTRLTLVATSLSPRLTLVVRLLCLI